LVSTVRTSCWTISAAKYCPSFVCKSRSLGGGFLLQKPTAEKHELAAGSTAFLLSVTLL